MVRVKLIITGRVQGVFYRYSTVTEAKRIGDLTGWVRNLPNGDVEALIEGKRNKVDELIQWCQKGPPGSNVLGVKAEWEKYVGEFLDFSILY